MDIQRAVHILIIVLSLSPSLGSAGDIVHEDDNPPKRPGCDNNFVLVRLIRFRFLFFNSMLLELNHNFILMFLL